MKFKRPEILDALPVGHAVIEASAGTGKTWTLEHLFVDLILGGASVESVLVVTFTEKATREMRARVRATLDAMVHPRAGDPRVITDADEPSAWTIDSVGRTRLRDALTQFDRAPISTIHGFCQRVLSEHAFQSARPFHQVLVEPRRAFGRSFRDEMRRVLKGKSPLRDVVLRVLDQLDADRLEEALFPWYSEHGKPRPHFDRARLAAALEHWTESGDEMDAQVRSSIARNDVAERVVLELRKLREIAHTFERDGDFFEALLALDRWGRHEVVRQAPARAWLPARLEAPGLAQLATRVESMLSVATSPFGVLVHELLPRVRTRLEAEKARHGWIDFDDMLRLVDEALRGPAGPALVATLRAQYRYALVDEFQDTDALQWSIFRRIFVDDIERAETEVSETKPSESTHALFVIGDPKQAIYGFRNADIHTYRRARALLLERGARRVALRDNHRSTLRVIDSYNAIFAEGFFQGDIKYDEPVRCGNRQRRLLDTEGRDLPAVLLWQVLGKEKPSVADVRRTLAQRVALEVERLVAGDVHFDDGLGEKKAIGYSDIQILTRNAREAAGIAEALAQQGIPHCFYKQDGLFDTHEARDVLAVLRAVADPHDRSARLRAWLTPFFAVPLADLEACAELDAQHPLVTRLHRLRVLADRHDRALFLRALLEESGLAKRLLFTKSSERELTNYQHVLEVLLEESGGSQGAEALASRLETFVDGRAEPVGGEGSVQRLESERAAVQLLTMHKSKGLEAAIVFVMGGFTRGGKGEWHRPQIGHVDGVREAWLSPLPRDVEQRIVREAREEDERLLYVALTRAKGRLVLPYFGMPPADAISLDGAWQRYGPLTGAYRWLAARLEVLVASGFVDGDRVQHEILPVADDADRDRRELAQVDWDALPALPPVASLPFETLKEKHAGYVLTSYTRMKSQRGGYVAPVSEDSSAAEEFTAEVQDAELPPEAELPGGPSMGVFLHGVLEDLDLPVVRDADELEVWESRPEVDALFLRRARFSGIDEVHLPAARRLIFDALRCPQSFGDVDLPQGFADIEGIAEMNFLYPVPERPHPALDTPPDPDAAHRIWPKRMFAAQRGVIRGVVDYVFERDGRTFFLDWKSDRLPLWSPEEAQAHLEAHVEANYALQAKLYTLGIVRLLDVHDHDAYESRFGGLLYCFLRSMRSPSAGVVFQRPSFDEVLNWERELREREEPWGYPIRLDASPSESR